MSNSENITAGVPQVSNLGPLLFLLCINDLPNCLDSSVPALFPDNTNLTTSEASASEIQDILEIELNKVHTWLLANKLTLNVKKTQYMLVRNRVRTVCTSVSITFHTLKLHTSRHTALTHL